MKKILSVAFLSAMLSSHSAAAASLQKCRDHKAETSPEASFAVDAKKGVAVKDGLMWRRCLEGQTGVECDGDPTQFHFQDIEKHIKKNAKHAGYSDWRLATIDELLSIVEKKCKNPAMNMMVFPGKHSKVWSSSKAEGRREQVWALYTITGSKFKTSLVVVSGVRLVRDVK